MHDANFRADRRRSCVPGTVQGVRAQRLGGFIIQPTLWIVHRVRDDRGGVMCHSRGRQESQHPYAYDQA